MAEQPIRKEDIIQGEEIKKTLTEIIDLLEKGLKSALDANAAAAAELNKALQGMNVTTAEGKKQVSEAGTSVSKLTAEQKQLLQISQSLEKEKTRMNLLEKEGVQNKIREVAELKKSNKEKEKEVVVGKAAAGSYRELSNRLIELRKRWADAAATGRKELEPQIRKLDNEVKKLDASVGRHQRNVGNYASALKRAGQMLKGFAVSMGLVGGGRAVVQTIEKMATFEKSLSNLRAITGASAEEMRRLELSAQRLGAITPRTATEVANLQTEFAKLGFTTREILAATEATLSLSIATGKDLAESANIAGSTLRAFGLDASEMHRVVDVMAKSFATSALNIDNMAEAMKYVAPVARAAGFTIEEASAMLAKLADAGIRGSMAGTGLRRVFLEIAKAGGPPQEAFKNLARTGITLAEANDEVGDRAQTALLILADQMREVDKLADVYRDAAGAGAEMAKVMEENLTGDITRLKSAWEGLVLSFKEGSNVVRDAVQWITGFINDTRDTIEGVRLFSAATGRDWVTIGNMVRGGMKDVSAFIDDTILKYNQMNETMNPESIENYINELESVIETQDQSKRSGRDIVDIAVMQIGKLERLLELAKEESGVSAEKAEADRIAAAEALLAQDLKEQAALKAAEAEKERIAAERAAQLAQDERTKAVEQQRAQRAKDLDKAMVDSAKNASAQIVDDANSTSLQLKDIKAQEVQDHIDAEQAKADFTKEMNREVLMERIQSAEQTFEVLANLNQTLGDVFTAQKQRELNAAGDNAQKREEIERKYFQREKALAISSAAINGALAITKVQAQTGILAVLMIPLIIASTLAQIAVISAQKFAEGGFTGKGSYRDETGERVAGIVHEDEFVINKRNTKKYRPIIEAIHDDDPQKIVQLVENGHFHELWGNVNYAMRTIQKQDPYTRMMYELLKDQPHIYTDSNGNTVIKQGSTTKVIKR